MKLITAFLRLIRWPNLVFIAVTQLLFYYCIVVPAFHAHDTEPAMSPTKLWLLILASVLIAAAGYIINDYFDLNIDRVNKPQKIVIEKIIKRRWAILWHLLFSFIGVLLSFYISYKLENPFLFIGIANLICAITLWVYSTTYKKKLLIGNIIISVLTAWTVLILYFAQWQRWGEVDPAYQEQYQLAMARVFKLAILYAGFAFIISLVREVIKDLEDQEGDSRYGCSTMPIEWGVPVSKVFAGVWLVVLIAVLLIVQFYVLRFEWWWSVAYCVILIIAPLVWLLRKLYSAQNVNDYRQLSRMIKAVMFTGILSMLFFSLYS